MNELLSAADVNPELDPVGSLVDADMGAYYHWINQHRLQGYDHTDPGFLRIFLYGILDCLY